MVDLLFAESVNYLRALPCGHGPFHVTCIIGNVLKSNKCPVCRARVSSELPAPAVEEEPLPPPRLAMCYLCKEACCEEGNPAVTCSFDGCHLAVHQACPDDTITDEMISCDDKHRSQFWCSEHADSFVASRGDVVLATAFERQPPQTLGESRAARKRRREARAEKKEDKVEAYISSYAANMRRMLLTPEYSAMRAALGGDTPHA